MKQTLQKSVLLLAVLVASLTFSQELPRTAYVMQGYGSNALSKVNLESGQVAVDFLTEIGSVPNKLVNFNDCLYLVNSTPDEIKILNPLQDDAFARSIALPAGSNPWDIGFVSTQAAYVTLFNTHQVAKVDLETGTTLKTFDVGTAPEGVLVTGDEAWISSTGYGGWGQPYVQAQVDLINTENDSVLATLPVPINAQVVAQGPDPNGWGGTFVHVLCTGNYGDTPGRIAVIDRWAASANYAPAVVDTIEIGGTPGDLVITPEGKGYCCAYGGQNGGEIYIYDAKTFEIIRGSDNPVYVGGGAMNLLYDELEGCLWITNYSDGTIQQFSTATDTVVATYETGLSPTDLALVGPLGRADAWADAVVSFNPGSNAGFGANFFPGNVLGAPDPDPAISSTSPCANPKELLSLGNGGTIVLCFEDNRIINGEGVDFTVFENAFISWSGGVVTEPAEVSVSQDGENWTILPWDTTGGALTGLAGVTPTEDNQNPTDPTLSGGDQFDLDLVGLEWVSFVKIRDLGAANGTGNTAGFDLDAVVAVHSESSTGVETQPSTQQPQQFVLGQNYPNPFNPETTIAVTLPRSAEVHITIYNSLGQRVSTLHNGLMGQGKHSLLWTARDDRAQPLPSGVYFCRLDVNGQHQIRKMLLVR